MDAIPKHMNVSLCVSALHDLNCIQKIMTTSRAILPANIGLFLRPWLGPAPDSANPDGNYSYRMLPTHAGSAGPSDPKPTSRRTAQHHYPV